MPKNRAEPRTLANRETNQHAQHHKPQTVQGQRYQAQDLAGSRPSSAHNTSETQISHCCPHPQPTPCNPGTATSHPGHQPPGTDHDGQ